MHCTFWAASPPSNFQHIQRAIERVFSVLTSVSGWLLLFSLQPELSQPSGQWAGRENFVNCINGTDVKSNTNRWHQKRKNILTQLSCAFFSWTAIWEEKKRSDFVFIQLPVFPLTHHRALEWCSRRWHNNQQATSLPGFCKISLFFAILLPYLGSFACTKGRRDIWMNFPQ